MAVRLVPGQAVVALLLKIKTMSYLETTRNVYKKAAEKPDIGLCCTTTPIWQLPGLDMPVIMQQMNYGCGSTVNPRD